MDSVSVIIAAAGSGTRMGMGPQKSKQFTEIRGVPVIARTLRVFEEIPRVSKIIIVTRKIDIEAMRELVKKYKFLKVDDIIEGGDTRMRSVRLGLERLGADKRGIVLIHDGARPFIERERVMELIHEIESERCEAAAVGVPVKDTIKQLDESGFIGTTPERSSLVSIQTPQAFRYDLIMKAHKRAESKGMEFTDDCAVVENLSAERVKVIIGDYTNIKITTPEDLIMAEMILSGTEDE